MFGTAQNPFFALSWGIVCRVFEGKINFKKNLKHPDHLNLKLLYNCLACAFFCRVYCPPMISSRLRCLRQTASARPYWAFTLKFRRLHRVMASLSILPTHTATSPRLISGWNGTRYSPLFWLHVWQLYVFMMKSVITSSWYLRSVWHLCIKWELKQCTVNYDIIMLNKQTS